MGGQWTGDQNLEMLTFTPITEGSLDWFPFTCDGQQSGNKLLKGWEFQMRLKVKLWSPLFSEGPVILKA